MDSRHRDNTNEIQKAKEFQSLHPSSDLQLALYRYEEAKKAYDASSKVVCDLYHSKRKDIKAFDKTTIDEAEEFCLLNIHKHRENMVAGAIKVRLSVPAIRYLIKMKNYPISGGNAVADPFDYNPRWNALEIAYNVSPDNTELFAMLIEAGAVIDVKKPKSIWHLAFDENNFKIISWLMQVANYGFDLLIDSMTDESRYTYNFNARTDVYNNFVAYFEHYSDYLIQADNLDKLLRFAEKYFPDFADELQERYLKVLTTILNSAFEESDNYDKLLAHFETIDIDAAIKARAEMLISNNDYDDAKEYCLSKLSAAVPSPEAAKQLAHLLLLQQITLDESENNPLDGYKLKHVIQACYYLRICADKDTLPDFQTCHALLSDGKVVNPSAKTWTPEAKRHFQTYALYKMNEGDTFIADLLGVRDETKNKRSALQNFGTFPKAQRVGVDKHESRKVMAAGK